MLIAQSQNYKNKINFSLFSKIQKKPTYQAHQEFKMLLKIN